VQVVAFQATMELMAEQFPGAFAGYRLQVVESHQRSKVDTSGTARAIVQSFQKLGLHFDEVRCVMAVMAVTFVGSPCWTLGCCTEMQR
jgi:4-hydroxy-tetrahydrodipicolinate reductase